MTALRQDVLYGLRMLLQKPEFTAMAALSRALDVAADTPIFSLIDNTLRRPLPFPDSSRLVRIRSVPLGSPDLRLGVTYPNDLAFRITPTVYMPHPQQPARWLRPAWAIRGGMGSLVPTRLIQSALYEVTSTDPSTFTAVSLVLMAVALIASSFPARRAVPVDPVIALRCE
jgi:hypothetical protein